MIVSKEKKVSACIAVTCLMMSLATSCNKSNKAVGPSTDTIPSNDSMTNTTASGRPAGWAFESHDKDAAPDYTTMFPDNVVNRMDIAISDSAWKALIDDMTSMAGTFGSTGAGGGAGMNVGGGVNGTGNSERPGMTGGQMPQAFYDAAVGKAPGDSCSCTMMGMTLSGIVDTAGGKAFCKPSMTDTGNGGMQGSGIPDGGGMNTEFLPREPVYIPVTIEFNGKKWTKVGFRLKGNSSLISAWGQGVYKLPFRIKTDEFEGLYPEVKNQRMYGFHALSLINNYMDNTMTHEKLAAELFRSFAVPAAKSAFIRLYIDYGQGKKYFGLYTMDELPEDDPFLLAWFGNKNGNIYKPEGGGANFNVYIDSTFEDKNNGKSSGKDVKALFNALHADRSQQAVWRSNLEEVFNVDIFLKWLAGNTVIGNSDTYGGMIAHNYYLYNNNDKLTWIPWDLGLSFNTSGGFGGGQQMPGGGSDVPNGGGMQDDTLGGVAGFAVTGAFGGRGSSDAIASIMHTQTDSTWPLIRFLLDDPVYHVTYCNYLRLFITNHFTAADLSSKAQAAHDLIAPFVTGIEAEQTGYTSLSSPQDFETAFAGLIQYITERAATVDSVLNVTQ